MTKKNDDFVLVPLRVEVPVGKRFKFAGGRVLYEIVEAPKPCACVFCALKDRRKKLQCASLSCAPYYRTDKKYVYVKKVYK